MAGRIGEDAEALAAGVEAGRAQLQCPGLDRVEGGGEEGQEKSPGGPQVPAGGGGAGGTPREGRLAPGGEGPAGDRPMSEDCLTLNVWAPAAADGRADRPELTGGHAEPEGSGQEVDLERGRPRLRRRAGRP